METRKNAREHNMEKKGNIGQKALLGNNGPGSITTIIYNSPPLPHSTFFVEHTSAKDFSSNTTFSTWNNGPIRKPRARNELSFSLPQREYGRNKKKERGREREINPIFCTRHFILSSRWHPCGAVKAVYNTGIAPTTLFPNIRAISVLLVIHTQRYSNLGTEW